MSLPRKAIVDADGNIVLPQHVAAEAAHVVEIEMEEEENVQDGAEDVCMEETVKQEEWNTQSSEAEAMWTVIEDEIEEQKLEHAAESSKRLEQAKAVWHSVRGNVYNIAGDVLQESARQYHASFVDGTHSGTEAARSLRGSAKRFWRFLTQPVWVPNRQKQPVQYSRGVLFVLDSARFGGTFAVLFGVLFATMNYQSFSSIAYSYIEPLAQVTGIVHAKSTDTEMAQKLKGIAPGETDADAAGSSEFLPPVGPPENRLVIPKLELNVPIVIPPMDALIAEDWKKLEEEIQAGLHDGVVHYPGTARPGKPGNFFLTGHSSYFPWDSGKYKSVFARLGELKAGDEYWVFYNGDRHRYIVDGKKEIKPADVSVLDQPIDERISTLMTCTPVGTTLRRLIITAKEVDPISGKVLEVGEHAEEMPKMKMEMLPI